MLRSGDCETSLRNFSLCFVKWFMVGFEVWFGSLSCCRGQLVFSFLSDCRTFSSRVCWFSFESILSFVSAVLFFCSCATGCHTTPKINISTPVLNSWQRGCYTVICWALGKKHLYPVILQYLDTRSGLHIVWLNCPLPTTTLLKTALPACRVTSCSLWQGQKPSDPQTSSCQVNWSTDNIPIKNQRCHDLVPDCCLNNITSFGLICRGQMMKREHVFNRITQWNKSKQHSSMLRRSVWLPLSLWLLDIKLTFLIRAFVLRQEPWSISDRCTNIRGSENPNQIFKHQFIEIVDTRVVLYCNIVLIFYKIC